MPSFSRKSPRSSAEWIGGIATLPSYVTGEGEPYRPQALFWMSPDGMVLGSEVARTGELLSQACASLRQTIRQPMIGPPGRPRRIRVASAELAAVLRAGQTEVEVVCAPTPELDALLVHLQESLRLGETGPQTYLSPGVTPEAVAAFFQAAAALHRRAPWTALPDDQTLIGLDIEALDVRGAVVSVIGQAGESFGFVLFDSLVDFDEYLDAAMSIERGQIPELPPHFAVNFERGADLAPELREEVAARGWEVAGASAYPWPVAIDGDLAARPPTLRELTLAEAICRALVKLLDEHGPAASAAWGGGDVFAAVFIVPTATQALSVHLTTPVAVPGCGADLDAGDGFLLSPDRPGRIADAHERKAAKQTRRRKR
jgi:hypothetical protein